MIDIKVFEDNRVINVSPKERTLVIGAGEIGKGLGGVLASAYDVFYKDLNQEPEGTFDVINICIPYSDNFVKIVQEYQKRYKPKLTIIHSTVRVGTTRKIGGNTVYSPVNGKHPNLEAHIRKFVKVIGATNGYAEQKTTDYLQKAGLRVFQFSSPEAAEYAKLRCTTRYGWYLTEMKDMVKSCEELNIPFGEAYTAWNRIYNEGYKEEAMYHRPIYTPMSGEIGGHCVIPNLRLFDSPIGDFIKKQNELYKKES